MKLANEGEIKKLASEGKVKELVSEEIMNKKLARRDKAR